MRRRRPRSPALLRLASVGGRARRQTTLRRRSFPVEHPTASGRSAGAGLARSIRQPSPHRPEARAASATEESLQWSAQEQRAASAQTMQPSLLSQKQTAATSRNSDASSSSARREKPPRRSSHLLEARMQNDAATELREAAEQQRQITQLRLHRWLEQTNHGHLDTHSRHGSRPAGCGSSRLSCSHTNDDWSLINDATPMQTAAASICCRRPRLYSRAFIAFALKPPPTTSGSSFRACTPMSKLRLTSRLQISTTTSLLLLTANGYTTYRGS